MKLKREELCVVKEKQPFKWLFKMLQFAQKIWNWLRGFLSF